MSNINNRIKEIRIHLKLTQKALAELVGMKWYQIKDIETGKTKVSVDFVSSLCEKFAINSDWLLTGNGSLGREKLDSIDKKDFSNIATANYQNFFIRFKNPETGLKNTEYLIGIEDASEELYKKVSGYLKTTHDAAKIMKNEKQKKIS